MSKYEWEQGSIKIPAKEWAKFRTNVIKCWNDHRTGVYVTAVQLHGRLKDAMKGKRGVKRNDALVAALQRYCPEREDNGAVRQLVVTYKHVYGKGYLPLLRDRPKKKELGLRPTSKSGAILLGDACIGLHNGEHKATWSVNENNHACDRARQHPVARRFFHLLNAMAFTQGNGGQIVGNDEYNRDSDYEGGGSNYVVQKFGPKKASSRRGSRAA